VVELRVPGIVEDPFREHYRSLILGSLLRSAEAQSERHRARGQKLRASRAERIVHRLPPPDRARSTLTPEPSPAPEPVLLPEAAAAPVAVPGVSRTAYAPWPGTTIRRTAAVVWFAMLAALLANIVVLGFDSYATAAADLGLVAMTFVWFFACIDDLIDPSP
jgi:hypothetical protein